MQGDVSRRLLRWMEQRHQCAVGGNAEKGGGMSRRLPDMDGPVLLG
jgi:hypothetical protein